MTSLTRYRPHAAVALFLIGIVLVVWAYVQAAAIPRLAHDDFGLLIQRYGTVSSTATYPDTYRSLSAQRRMLQNAYLGGGGLILITIGGLAFLRTETVGPARPLV